ncbi:MAG: class I SAM-dependent methyltransferase [Chloroflexota bacterium]|nr:class I SAM-dependent methyltransferase [Chloroflexota bacterium]
MTTNDAECLAWAVGTLAVGPTDRLLEIGCGHGVAISLVVGKLGDGHITAIDRSAKMIAMVEKRNAVHVAADKATFQVTSLADMDLGDKWFDKIFAVNVDLFRAAHDAELAVITRHLSATGALYLVHQDPWVPKSPAPTERLIENLAASDFMIAHVLRQEMTQLPINCIVACPS